MTIRRAAVYFGGGALLLAYLAAADSTPTQFAPPPRDTVRRAAPLQPDALAADVRAQAARLRERIAVAPAPEERPRNPFSFAPAADSRTAPFRRSASPTVAEAAPPIAVAPVLALMGVAEDAVAGAVHRTAIIGGPADALYMVAEGETVADRYQVTSIGADAVELKDLLTGGYRRLAMR